MAQEFFNAPELAEIAKNGGIISFPQTKSGVIRYAEREAWHDLPKSLKRTRAGRGGGTEYHWSILPGLMQAAISARENASQIVEAHALKRASEKRQLASLVASGRSGAAQAVERTRSEILRAIEGYAISHGQTRAWSIRKFLEAQKVARQRQDLTGRLARGEILTAAEAGILTLPCELTSQTGFDLVADRLALANDRKGAALSRATIYAWFKALDQGGFGALSPIPPKEAQPIPKAFLDFLKIYAMPAKPTIAAAHADYMKWVQAVDGVQYEPVTLSQCRNILRHRLNNIEAHIGREGILTLKARMGKLPDMRMRLTPADRMGSRCARCARPNASALPRRQPSFSPAHSTT